MGTQYRETRGISKYGLAAAVILVISILVATALAVGFGSTPTVDPASQATDVMPSSRVGMGDVRAMGDANLGATISRTAGMGDLRVSENIQLSIVPALVLRIGDLRFSESPTDVVGANPGGALPPGMGDVHRSDQT